MKALHRRNAELGRQFTKTARTGALARVCSATAAASLALVLLSGCVRVYSGGTQMISDPEATLDKRVALARQYIGVGDWENAKRNLELAQAIDPTNAEVFEAFALVYQSAGEFELAEQQFKAALKADPELSRARNNYAAFLYSQGRFVAAEAGFARITDDTLYNGRPTAFVNLGLCRLQLSNPQGAEAAFSRALSMDRRNPVALLEMDFLRLEAGDTDEAKRYHGAYEDGLSTAIAAGAATWPANRRSNRRPGCAR